MVISCSPRVTGVERRHSCLGGLNRVAVKISRQKVKPDMRMDSKV